jgi:hypothetical protein
VRGSGSFMEQSGAVTIKSHLFFPPSFRGFIFLKFFFAS